MTFLADVGDSIKAIVSGGRKLDSPGYSGGSSGTGFGAWGGMRFLGSHSPGAGINYAHEAGELRFNSIVAACLQVRYKAISAAPPYLAQKNAEGGWDRVKSHSLQSLLDVPNGFYGRNALWGATDGARCASNAGSGFWRINWLSDHSEPGEILWEANASPVWDKQSFIKEYHVNNGRGVDTYAAAVNFDWQRNRDNKRPCIVQFRYQLDPFNPRNGWSPLQTVLRQIATDNGLSSSLAAVVRNAAMPGWGVTSDGSGGVESFVTPAEVERVVTMLDKLARGEGAGRTIGTNAAVKFDKLTLNPDDVASPKINSFDVERICAVLDVPPLLIGLNTDSNATYANQEQAGKKFWNSMLLEMDSMGDAIEGQIFPLYRDLNRENFCIMWDTSQIEALQESQDAKFTRASTGTNKSAFLTVNEARQHVGLSKLDKPEYDEIPGGAPEPDQGADGAKPFSQAAVAKALADFTEADHHAPLRQLRVALQVLEAEEAKSLGRTYATHLTQPRDDLGRWTSGGGTLNAAHVATVLRSEGVHESRHAEVLGKIASGEHTTRAQVLEHIDRIHDESGLTSSEHATRAAEIVAAAPRKTTAQMQPGDVIRSTVWRKDGIIHIDSVSASGARVTGRRINAAGEPDGESIRLDATQQREARREEWGRGKYVREPIQYQTVPAEAIRHSLAARAARKSLETDMQVLDALPVPEPLPDPNDVALTDAEIAALEDTENPESIALAYGRATVAGRAILGAQEAR